MAVLFQKASELGVPQIPIRSSSRAVTAAANATLDTCESALWSATQAGPKLQKQYPSNTRAVSRKRPLVLVYSPSTTMTMTISTAKTDAATSPIANGLGFIKRLSLNLKRGMI
ncbi:uncharacterized protein METZ01_LOCUS48734 [marine metagenome]|uniref:Uncharacterized protein n=1 Tax=marine metagenome TaxID=408172 RepID=A0A381RVI9_9ZZZZ